MTPKAPPLVIDKNNTSRKRSVNMASVLSSISINMFSRFCDAPLALFALLLLWKPLKVLLLVHPFACQLFQYVLAQHLQAAVTPLTNVKYLEYDQMEYTVSFYKYPLFNIHVIFL